MHALFYWLSWNILCDGIWDCRLKLILVHNFLPVQDLKRICCIGLLWNKERGKQLEVILKMLSDHVDGLRFLFGDLLWAFQDLTHGVDFLCSVRNVYYLFCSFVFSSWWWASKPCPWEGLVPQQSGFDLGSVHCSFGCGFGSVAECTVFYRCSLPRVQWLFNSY